MAKGRNHSYMKYVSVVEKAGRKKKDQEAEESGEGREGATGRAVEQVGDGSVEDLSKRLNDEMEKRKALEKDMEEKDGQIRDLNDRFQSMEGRDLEEELRQKVEELNQIKNAYAKKMKNTIALQRIKYEREIDKIRRDYKRLALAKGLGETITEDDFKKKETELEQKEADLAAREKRLEELKGKLESSEGGTLAVAAGEASLGGMETAIQGKGDLIAKMEEKLKNREEELNEIKEALEAEKKKREAISQELLNVKKGSVAMMKYNMSVQQKKAEDDLAEMRNALEAEVQKRQQMEEELSKREEEIATREGELTRRMEDLSKGKIDIESVKTLQAEIEKRNAEVKNRETKLKTKEKEIIDKIRGLEDEIKKKLKDGKILQDIKREFAQKEEDLKRIKTILKEKEEELKRKEKEVDRRMREGTVVADKSAQEQITALRTQLAQKEKEMEEAIADAANVAEKATEGVDTTAINDLRQKLNDKVTELSKKDAQIAKLTQKLSEMAAGKGADVGSASGTVSGDVTQMQVELESKNQEITILKQDLFEAQKAAAGKGTLTMKKGAESATLTALNEEIKELRAKLDIKNVEYDKISQALQFKEDEFNRREMEITHKEKVLKAEMVRIKEAKDMGGSIQEVQLKKRLEALEQEIAHKEDEVKKRESYITQKLKEMEAKEQKMVDGALETRAEERKMEFEIQKAKTGNSRLDDLLFGGIPFGTNILIMGPAFIGKETLVNNFLVEGITKGIAGIIITTDCSPDDIREELKFMIPEIVEYEKKGLLKYIDVYSKAMGLEAADPNTVYVEHPTDYKGINQALLFIIKGLQTSGEMFRLVVRSISTLVTYSQQQETFRFLQGLTGIIKRSRVVAMYLLDKGMHTDPEIQTLGHLMDGSLEFRTDGVKTFLEVQGVGDAQSRQWVQYQYSKRGLTIGSFSLDKIK